MTTSPFLSLPGELRNKIYIELLRQTYPVVAQPWPHGGGYKGLIYTLGEPLLYVNRQIRREALSIQFKHNCFTTQSVDCAFWFLTFIGQFGRSHIESFLFEEFFLFRCLKQPRFPYTMKLLASCPRLQSVECVIDAPRLLHEATPRWYSGEPLPSVEDFLATPPMMAMFRFRGLKTMSLQYVGRHDMWIRKLALQPWLQDFKDRVERAALQPRKTNSHVIEEICEATTDE